MTISRADLDAGRVVYTDPDIDTAAPRLPPVHPGDILRDEFMGPLGLTAYRVAHDIAVPTNRISGLMAGRRALTADTAIRLSAYFGVTAEFWMGLQSGYDLEMMRAEVRRRRQERNYHDRRQAVPGGRRLCSQV